jgi:hypothetical protein
MIGNCNSGVPHGLDVDGCTINDRIRQIAASTKNHSEFVRRLGEVLWAKHEKHLLRHRDLEAIGRCITAAK